MMNEARVKTPEAPHDLAPPFARPLARSLSRARSRAVGLLMQLDAHEPLASRVKQRAGSETFLDSLGGQGYMTRPLRHVAQRESTTLTR